MKKSHRGIKPETFTNKEVKLPKPKKAKGANKRPKLTLRQKWMIKKHNFKQRVRNFFMRNLTEQTERVIRKKVTDSTWYGKVLFAILDVVSLPNFHEVWKAVQKELPEGTFKERLKLFWQKLDGIRTVVAILVSLAYAYGILI